MNLQPLESDRWRAIIAYLVCCAPAYAIGLAILKGYCLLTGLRLSNLWFYGPILPGLAIFDCGLTLFLLAALVHMRPLDHSGLYLFCIGIATGLPIVDWQFGFQDQPDLVVFFPLLAVSLIALLGVLGHQAKLKMTLRRRAEAGEY